MTPDKPIPSKWPSPEPLVLLAFVVGWFVLQMWVLPKFGVST